MASAAPPIGRRIHVTGNSSSGKSTLAAALADALAAPLVELDALNWLPDWVGLNTTNPGELDQRIRDATAGDSWVVAGSYMDHAQRMFWPRVQTVIWLDLPAATCLWRMTRRSWQRWRNNELLWGTNYERFWPQFKVWSGEDSLAWWITTQHARKRRNMLAYMADRRWSHVYFLRLTSASEIESLVRSVRDAERNRAR